VANGTRPLPNFFIVGAPKAGTTSLYHYLDQHPQIYLSPIKEPNYFASEVRPENYTEELQQQVGRDMRALQEYLGGPMCEKRFGGVVSEWEDYLRLFQNVKSERAIGEASVCYLWSRTAAANIFSKIPDAKIIMILRDPADRAFSQYLHALRMGLVRRSFPEEIETSLHHRGGKFGVLYPWLEFGLYYEQVKRYLELFPRTNVRVYFFEEYRKQPRELLADLHHFLDVEFSVIPNMEEKHLEAEIPRSVAISAFLRKYGIWQRAKELSPSPLRRAFRRVAFRPRKSHELDPKDRKRLVDYYREDVSKLTALLDRDLRAWLD
jgi:hypothetical protein